MKRRLAPVGAIAAAILVGAGCGRNGEGSSELVRELRAMRGTLERMQGSQQEPRGPAMASRLDVGALQHALQPLRELVQTLLTEQEALRGRQDALAGEMSRWAEIVAPVLQGSPAGDLRGLQDRLGKLEEELRAQETRHREVQDLLLRAMDTTSERLETFLRTLGEIRPAGAAGAAPGAKGGRDSTSDPDGKRAEPPGESPPGEERAVEAAPPDRTPPVDPVSRAGLGGRSAPSSADAWTPWVLLAAGAIALLFVWRLWREPGAPPIVPPAAEHDMQDWWVVVEELAQAMGAQPAHEQPAHEQPVPEEFDVPDMAPAYPVRAEDAGAADGERVSDVVAGELGLPDPEPTPRPSPVAPRADPPHRSSAEDPAPAAGPASARRDGPAAPAAVEWEERCDEPESALERMRGWLSREPRVLLRPEPEVQVVGDRLRARAWVMGDLSAGERRHVWTEARQALHSRGETRGLA